MVDVKSSDKNRRRPTAGLSSSAAASSLATLTASMIRPHGLSVLAMAPNAAESLLASQESQLNISNLNSKREFNAASAPVSSLLPPLPAAARTAFSQTDTQAQLLALLQQSSARSSFGLPSPSPSVGFAGLGAAELNMDFRTGQASSTGSVHTALLSSSMHNWSLDKLEQHARMLRQLNQSVPPTIDMLLLEARRRQDKRQAKRLANRKSASTSRARKKAMVKEMTELNSRLRRQALILALLPDLVIVVDVQGVILFCSAQAERVLHHKIEDLVGAKLADILSPSSRPKLRNLIEHLVESDKAASSGVSDPEKIANARDQDEKGADPKDAAEGVGDGCAQPAQEEEGEQAAVTDPSFPLSVVKLGTAADAGTTENDTSDTSATKNVSSLTNTASITRSPTASSLGNGSDDNGKAEKTSKNEGPNSKSHGKDLPSSDISNSSSSSADAKKLENANDNLVRNVQWHNKQMKHNAVGPFLELGYRDDVTGAAVTANNASARLSSLQHCPGSSSSEGDSGYRESNDSREETSSSASDSSEPNGRRKPLAPTCNVCLIRSDMTTVWCEVTSSIRTRELDDEPDDTMSEDMLKAMKDPSSSASGTAETMQASFESSDPIPPKESKEILLCLRPIRDGDRKVGQKLRLVASTVPESTHESKAISDDSRAGAPSSSDEHADSKKSSANLSSTKKRPSAGKHLPRPKRMSTTRISDSQKDVDNEVVESLMLMSNKKD